jgi:hypothetical protein
MGIDPCDLSDFVREDTEAYADGCVEAVRANACHG